jgi:hypothetical protein
MQRAMLVVTRIINTNLAHANLIMAFYFGRRSMIQTHRHDVSCHLENIAEMRMNDFFNSSSNN